MAYRWRNTENKGKPSAKTSIAEYYIILLTEGNGNPEVIVN